MKRQKKRKKRNPIAKAVKAIKPNVVKDTHKHIISTEDYESRLRDYYQDQSLNESP
jgi:hypothetical protein